MRDILPVLRGWLSAGAPFGLATVVGVRESAPRAPGAAMAVGGDGTVAGSVSGGCVEGAVYEVAREMLAGAGPRVVRYGISDDEASAVGLTCGGTIDVLVEQVSGARAELLAAVADAVDTGKPVAVATVVESAEAGGRGAVGVGGAPDASSPVQVGAKLAVWPDHTLGGLGDDGLDAAVTDDARGLLEQGRTGQRRYGPSGQRRADEVAVFIDSYAPRPRLLVFGAIDFAAAMARLGAFLGYAVTVCDARATFATAERFPDADEVVVAWPHRYLSEAAVDGRTVICVLTHDPKFDVPLLEVALRTPAAYIGAMGSRRTCADRLARLRERGLSEQELQRLRSPIGLDLGARTPEETAVSIAAEITALRWGGSGAPLGAASGPIHHPAVETG